VPLEESQRIVDQLKRIGMTHTKLTIYPEAGHDSWTETYNNPELYNWLLEHERKTGTK
jgi:predicted peptidase